jgi:hypothetical protein
MAVGYDLTAVNYGLSVVVEDDELWLVQVELCGMIVELYKFLAVDFRKLE